MATRTVVTKLRVCIDTELGTASLEREGQPGKGTVTPQDGAFLVTGFPDELFIGKRSYPVFEEAVAALLDHGADVLYFRLMGVR
jgi:hypothetical protein